MNEMGIGGRLYNWLLDCLSNRTLCVKVGDAVSHDFEIVNAIPQGSVISPILFNSMINDISMNVSRDIGSLL